MIKEAVECIDAGTEFCPCKLAEKGQCLICSQCQGKSFCDCLNWKGVCIYQELYNNGFKAKNGRKTHSCKIQKIDNYNDKLLVFSLTVPHKLALDLVKPGSYIFVKSSDDDHSDIPISIMHSDIDCDILYVAIEVRGIKTTALLSFKESQYINIRGPYWNGIFGLKNIESQKNNKTLILARGIGMAPMIPIIRRLINNNNSVDLVLDSSPFESNFIQEFLNKYPLTINKADLLQNGDLSDYGKVIIKNALDEGIKYIHVGGADILTYSVIKYLDNIKRNDILLSCCNNFKMCCGEGTCGACTARFAGHKVRRFCKEQADPRSIFEGRRFI